MVDATPQPLWVSITKLAELKGKSKQALSKRVTRLESEGLVSTKEVDGKKLVNLVEFDRAIGANTDPAQALRNPGGITQPTTPIAASAASPAPNDTPSSGQSQYTQSRALRESYDAENSRLDLEERLGRLLDKAEEESRIFRIFRRTRDRLLSFPAIAGPKVFNATDERHARQIMDEEVRKVLTALADEIDHRSDDDSADANEPAFEGEADVVAGGDTGAA